MKKLLFLLAGAFLALSSYASAPAEAASASGTVITKAGFAPEYFEGELCAIFVTIEVDQMSGEIVRLVDPLPHVYKVRYNGQAWVDISDRGILLNHDVRFDSGELSVDFTYQYPGEAVQHFSLSIRSYPVGQDQ
ncbi:MAG: hypothetical protein LIO68_07045 [Rikenellaceae bacterium]|nr:hypothetical protein [Rikenellaceae bacterium]